MSMLAVEGPDARGLSRLSLQRPDRSNALSAGLVEALLEILAQAAANATRVLVLQGEGKNFCAGFDLSDSEAESDASLALRFIRIEQMLQAIAASPFLTVARVQGAAFGAGADIVAACDHRLALPGARFRFPGYSFGVALGTRRLAALTGAAAAQAILSSGRVVTTEEALSRRLLTAVCDAEAIEAEINWLANGLAVLDASSAVTLVTQARQPDPDPDADLAMLVRSVAAPGLKSRLAAYVARARENARSTS